MCVLSWKFYLAMVHELQVCTVQPLCTWMLLTVFGPTAQHTSSGPAKVTEDNTKNRCKTSANGCEQAFFDRDQEADGGALVFAFPGNRGRY